MLVEAHSGRDDHTRDHRQITVGAGKSLSELLIRLVLRELTVG